MINHNLKTILSFVLTLLLVVLQPHLADANLPFASLALSENSALTNIVFNNPSPTNRGTSGSSVGKGTRGPCDNQGNESSDPFLNQLIALIPTLTKPGEDESQDVWGNTGIERPEFLFYIPPTATPAKSAEFKLEDEGDYKFISPVSLPKSAGIISLSLPNSAAPLQSDHLYYWSLKVYCDRQKSSQPNFMVDGWINRVTLQNDLVNQLKSATPEDRVVIYAREGIWFEAIAQLAKLQHSGTQEAAIAWEKLLKFVGLEKLAQQAILF